MAASVLDRCFCWKAWAAASPGAQCYCVGRRNSMRIAFVFPGQGSQSVGMMNSFSGLPCVRDTFSEASDAIGENIWKLVEDGPADELDRTVNTQPAMLTAGIALFRAWNAENGVQPVAFAGHSLGEYSALVASGAIDFSEAMTLVRFR